MTKSTAHDDEHHEQAVESEPVQSAAIPLADLERDLAHVDAQLATIAGLPQYATEERAFRDRREALQKAIAVRRS